MGSIFLQLSPGEEIEVRSCLAAIEIEEGRKEIEREEKELKGKKERFKQKAKEIKNAVIETKQIAVHTATNGRGALPFFYCNDC